MITLSPENRTVCVKAVRDALRRDGNFDVKRLYETLQKQFRVSAYASDGDEILREAVALNEAEDAENRVPEPVVVPSAAAEVQSQDIFKELVEEQKQASAITPIAPISKFKQIA